MIVGRIPLLFTILLLTSSTQALPADDNQQQSQIVEVQQKLTAVRNEVERLLGDQEDIYDQLDKIETELELSSRLLRELRKQSKVVAVEISATTDTIARLAHLSVNENASFALHLRELYKSHEPHGVLLPFTSVTLNQSPNPEYLYRRLISQEKRQLGDLHADLAGHQELLTSLMTRKTELAELTDAERVEEQRAKEAIRQRERLLARVKGEQRQKLREIDELQESSQLLGDIVARLDAERNRTMDVVWQKERELTMRMKGKLYRPVRGEVLTSFGTKKDSKSGLSSKSNGVNIATNSGAKVVAALTGEVLYIGWARGLEKFVVVDHGGSLYSLYGNLDQLSVNEGDQVIRGEQFATATGDRLHFEIRDGKLPIDPMEWFKR